MTTVNEFITNLTTYAASAPGYGNAEVLLRIDDNFCLLFGTAKSAVGATAGQLALILEPNTAGPRVHLKEMSIQ